MHLFNEINFSHNRLHICLLIKQKLKFTFWKQMPVYQLEARLEQALNQICDH